MGHKNNWTMFHQKQTVKIDEDNRSTTAMLTKVERGQHQMG
jgi:hypothetical protein